MESKERGTHQECANSSICPAMTQTIVTNLFAILRANGLLAQSLR